MTDLSPQYTPLPQSRRLSQGQKAAVIVRLLVSGGADPGIRDLPKDQQRRLVREMASLRFVDRQTLAETVAEFAAELDSIGLHFPRDIDRILATLDGRLSLDVVEALLAESGGDVGALGGAAWDGIAALDDEVIADLMAGETVEVCAILLSKLPPKKAAQLLATLPQDRADDIAIAFNRTEDVTPEAVSRIGNALGRQSDARVKPAFDSAAVKRVSAILNAASTGARRGILQRLEANEPEFAARIKASLFSYENIPDRIAPRDMPGILRGVDDSTLVTAIAGAPEELAPVAEFIFSTISSRLADQFREQVAEATEVTDDAAEEAMSKIVEEIRRLEDAGELTLLARPE